MRSRIARSKSACLALLASTRLALRLFSLRFNLHPSPQISYASNKTCCGSYDISWRGTLPACNICVRIKRTISHETFPILPSQNLSLANKPELFANRAFPFTHPLKSAQRFLRKYIFFSTFPATTPNHLARIMPNYKIVWCNRISEFPNNFHDILLPRTLI